MQFEGAPSGEYKVHKLPVGPRPPLHSLTQRPGTYFYLSEWMFIKWSETLEQILEKNNILIIYIYHQY